MSQIPSEILGHIFSYLTNNPDRNTVSSVCKSWYEADRRSRPTVLIGNCYALSPERLIGRFTAVRSLSLKGRPRFADFNRDPQEMYREIPDWDYVRGRDQNWIPRNWGGSVHPWVEAMARSFPNLQELKLKRMVVLDQTLELISCSFPNFKSLVLISCSGFSASGLGAIASNCRFLEHLVLQKCKVCGDDNGQWLSRFPESCTSLISLDFSCLKGAVNAVDLERLVARCPNLKTLRLNSSVPLHTLSKIMMLLAPQLVELGIGPQMFGPHIFDPQNFGPHIFGLDNFELSIFGPHVQHTQSIRLSDAIRNCKSIRSLSGSQISLLLNTPSICSNLVSLDMSSSQQVHSSASINFIRHCRKLQRLWILDSIGDRGLLVVASTCKDLRDFRLFQSFRVGGRVNGPVTGEGLVAISKGCPLLHSLQFFCHQMTNAALITVSKNCPNLTCFGLSIRSPKDFLHITMQPLDEGFCAIVQSCKGLKRLALSGLLTDQVFLYIGMYAEQLEVLSAQSAGDSYIGMLDVLNGCRKLKKLEVTSCPFGDTALLTKLERYGTMQCLLMSSCEITLGGCKVLARKMPLLNVEVINEENQVEDVDSEESQVEEDYQHDSEENQVEDYHDDRLKVKKLYIYRTLDGPRKDTPKFVWTL